MLNFSAITNNDMLIKTVVRKKSDCELLDLTDYTIKVEFFDLSGNVLFTKSTDDATVTIPSQAAFKGQFEFIILDTDTVDFASGVKFWEPVLTAPDGSVSTVFNDDENLTPGAATFRKQLTVQ